MTGAVLDNAKMCYQSRHEKESNQLWGAGEVVEHFVACTTARSAAQLVRVNMTTVAYYYHRLRELIYRAIADTTPLVGEIVVDESYFGGHRKGKRGRGAAGKVPVFGR